uniref:Uncharacterized protein n=1 Tax=Oryza brachyantha TaxID=4533 RepID=J3MNG3_ORYBR
MDRRSEASTTGYPVAAHMTGGRSSVRRSARRDGCSAVPGQGMHATCWLFCLPLASRSGLRAGRLIFLLAGDASGQDEGRTSKLEESTSSAWILCPWLLPSLWIDD